MNEPTSPYAIRTQAEVGRMLGLTQTQVSDIERRALRKLFFALKKYAGDCGYDTSQEPVALKNQLHLGRARRAVKQPKR